MAEFDYYGRNAYFCGGVPRTPSKPFDQMNINSAEFRFSSSKLSQIPVDGMPEFAFIGRSNVGKSSLINMLTGHGSLAKVSGTPGKTRLINHFLINGSWYLVDLPGYGYARASKSAVKEFSGIIKNYITGSEKLHFLFVLVDSRHTPMKIDLDFMNMLGMEGVPFGIVFTKSDKQSPGRRISTFTGKHSRSGGKRCLPYSLHLRKKGRAGRRYFRSSGGVSAGE